MANLRRGVFAGAITLSLGFGAGQAFAKPAPAANDGPPKCEDWCDRFCRLIGAHSGTCTESGGCACAL